MINGFSKQQVVLYALTYLTERVRACWNYERFAVVCRQVLPNRGGKETAYIDGSLAINL